MNTFWITFYSYKGGVGRSMALANVAADLASKGRRVLMIDFDLEAPGLDSFEEFAAPKGTEGLVEYVCHYLTTNEPAPVKDFIHEVQPLDLSDPKNPKPRTLEGRLWLMTSGAKNDSYNQKRLSIDWADLYDHRSGADFIENLKADIEETFQPDYVLVDSRTGLTDVGGVCTLHLPDLVVLLFSLNEQNLQGIASVARVLRDSEKFPRIIPVATPVPNVQGGTGSLLEQRNLRAEELLGTEVNFSLSYSPIVALKERIIVWDSDTLLRDQYEKLAEALREADPSGIDFLTREAREALDHLDLDRAREFGDALIHDYNDRVDTWLTLADYHKLKGELPKMEEFLLKAFQLSPRNKIVYGRIEQWLENQRRFDQLLDLVTRSLEHGEDLSPDLLVHLRSKRGEIMMRKSLPEQAFPDYQFLLESQKEKESKDKFLLLFNAAEAHRRVSHEITREDWLPIVKVFEEASAGVSSLPAARRANQTQAMHVAYACVGDLPRAKSLLDETKKVLSQVSRQERVFCVADYDYLPLPRFLERNREMREALDRGELWDGMKVG